MGVVQQMNGRNIFRNMMCHLQGILFIKYFFLFDHLFFHSIRKLLSCCCLLMIFSSDIICCFDFFSCGCALLVLTQGRLLINFRVRLIASVPGRHTGVNKTRWGHLKLCKVIMNYWFKLRSLKFGICLSCQQISPFSKVRCLSKRAFKVSLNGIEQICNSSSNTLKIR